MSILLFHPSCNVKFIPGKLPIASSSCIWTELSDWSSESIETEFTAMNIIKLTYMQKFILDDHWKIETEFTKNREDLQGGQGYKLKSSNSTRVTIFQVFRLKQLGNTWDSWISAYGNWESGKLLLPYSTLGADSIDLPRHRRPLEHITHGWGQSAGNREHLQGGQGYELKSPYNSTDVATTEESRYFKFSD
jgi:hypothetical protein